MQLGMIGLGRMGGNMVRRLMRGGHQCVVFDRNPENVKSLVAEGATGASSMEDFAQKLSKPRAAWVMVPAGGATESTVLKLAGLMEAGDTIIDGGNSYFKDDIRRGHLLKDKGIHYVDVGTSGGVWGIERGYCMMLGGSKESADRLDPIFKTLAPGKGDVAPSPGRENKKSTAENGYLYCGPSGAGRSRAGFHRRSPGRTKAVLGGRGRRHVRWREGHAFPTPFGRPQQGLPVVPNAPPFR